MIETEDWDKLYYAIIRISPNKDISVFGIGSTKLICRNSALDHVSKKYSQVSERLIHVIEEIDVNCIRKMFARYAYTMVYCEAKVYIYGKRYGFDNMIVSYDPTYKEDLIRFAGYKHKIKGDK